MQSIYIYRSNKQANAYLFLPEKDNFKKVPEELLKLLGELSFSFDFRLDSNKKLMQSTAEEVLKEIDELGFFLQLSPKKAATKQDLLAKVYRR